MSIHKTALRLRCGDMGSLVTVINCVQSFDGTAKIPPIEWMALVHRVILALLELVNIFVSNPRPNFLTSQVVSVVISGSL